MSNNYELKRFSSTFLQFQSFLNSVRSQLKESEISMRQGIETALNNIAWHSLHYDTLSSYFGNN